MERVYNFSAGPSMLPLEVLKAAGSEITCAHGTGQSVMEMSHRSRDFIKIIERAEALLREILSVPEDYTVLFLQGGAMLQFSMVPLNLGAVNAGEARKKATYIDTGVWAGKAAEEAKKYVDVRIGASSKDKNYSYIPAPPPPQNEDSFYHICLNNTIFGTIWNELPETGAVPLVSDASSCLLSEPLDVRRFGLIYAGAQKNLGPAGCTLVIIRSELLGGAPDWTPVMLRYDIHAKEKSLFNTPPCWSIYIMSLVFEWILKLGGLPEMAKRNREKAAALYGALESSPVFRPTAEKQFRSLMNVPFVAREENAEKRAAIESRFLNEAAAAGLINLAGHRLAGGLRASIYNAMPIEGVAALVKFIKNFDPK
jgi:phosphoserine aminotransferase